MYRNRAFLRKTYEKLRKSPSKTIKTPHFKHFISSEEMGYNCTIIAINVQE